MDHVYTVKFYDKDTEELVCYYSTSNLLQARQMEKAPLQNAQVKVYHTDGYRV